MSREPGPVFLERRTYRRRRMADAARLLPVAGAVLFLLPLLWTGQDDTPTHTTRVMFFVFGVWIVLAVVSALISRGLTAEAKEPPSTGGR